MDNKFEPNPNKDKEDPWDKERRKVVFSPEITGQAMPVMKLYFIGS